VVSANGGKALNHFNKVHKGELVAALAADMPDLPTPQSLVDWAKVAGVAVELRASTVRLVV
jgi:hypothetical protein